MNQSQNYLYIFNSDGSKKVYNIKKVNQLEIDKIIEELKDQNFVVKSTIRFSKNNSMLYNKVVVRWFRAGEQIGSFIAAKLIYIEDNYVIPNEEENGCLTKSNFENLQKGHHVFLHS
jgi:hypothetical protein